MKANISENSKHPIFEKH